MDNAFKIKKGINLIPETASVVTAEGDLSYNDATKKLEIHDGTSADSVVQEAKTATLTNKTISGASNTITNVDGDNVVISPSGNLAATDVQAAVVELQTDVDTRALDSDLSTHISDTTTHGTTGDIVGTSDTQTLSNKTFSDAPILAEIATPATPSSGFGKIYFKSDGKAYSLDSSGLETELGGGGSGSGRITSWSTISSNTTLAPSTGYIVDSATDVVLTLPANFAVGDTIIVIGKGAGLWSIKANTGQIIRYLSERVSGTLELTASSSDDVIELNGISTNTEMSVVQFTGTPYANINYFGDGSDGALSTAGDETITSTSDGDMIVKNYTSLTINSGHTMTVSNRCKGLLIYVDGDCTIDGTLTMTARGANVNASTAGVSASGLRIKRFKSGSTDSDPGTDLLSGCGAAAIAAENNQESIAGFGKVYTIPRDGGSGAGAPAATNNDEYRNGTTGGTTSGGSGGGGSGGSGHANASGSTQAGGGNAGTCFSGGAAGGGAFANNSSGSGGGGASNGGAGGNGFNGGGGAGNPGGSGSHTGGNGTGGLLILIVRGNLTIGASGFVSANGMAGGSGDNASRGSGGGSGGGIILMLHGGTYTNNGTVQANGGAGGSNVFTTGGSGGAGSVTVDQIDQ